MLYVSCHPDGCYLSTEPESERAIPVELDPRSEAVIRHVLALDSFAVSEALGRLALSAPDRAGSRDGRPAPGPG